MAHKIMALAKHGAVTPEHLHKMLDKSGGHIDFDTYSDLDDAVGFDSDHLHKMITSPDNSLDLKRSVVRHPNAASDTYEHAMDHHHDDSTMLRSAIKNAYEKSTLDKAVNHPVWYVRQRAALNDHITMDHLRQLEKDPDERVSQMAKDTIWHKENS